MLPTFLIAGAAKAGTTSLWEYLSAHPQIGMAVLKEPGFFTSVKGCGNRPDPQAPRFSGRYERGLAWYESLFRACDGAKAVGEASVTYMTEPDAPVLIRRHLPGVQLIFLLRHPVDRLISHYWQEKRHGWSLPGLAEMIQERHPTLQRYIYVSSYHLHLKRYFEIFPRAQILLLFYQDLQQNPVLVVQEVYRFLGVDDRYLPANLGERYNPGQAPGRPALSWLFRWIAQHQWRLAQNQRLFALARPLGRWFFEHTRPNLPVPVLESGLRSKLVKEFYPTVAFLEATCQRDLSAWRS